MLYRIKDTTHSSYMMTHMKHTKHRYILYISRNSKRKETTITQVTQNMLGVDSKSLGFVRCRTLLAETLSRILAENTGCDDF